MTGARFLPAVLWAALIALFSAEAWSAAGTGFLVPFLASLVPWAAPEQLKAGVWLIRKCAHFVEYAVLAGLWRWGFAPRGAAGWLAFGLSLAPAVLAAAPQGTPGSPTGTLADGLPH